MTASAVPGDRPVAFDRDLIATAAVTTFSLAVAAGFARVFSGWSFFGDLALLAVVGHGTSFALRRARITGWLAVPFVGVLLAWLVAALQYPDTLRWGWPTPTTWDVVQLEVGLVRDQFATAVAPVLYGAGWATLAAVAMVSTVIMADTFAFRAQARGEALVPGGVLFVFIAALGSPRLRIGSTVVLIAAGVLAVVALRALHDRTRRVELTSRRSVSLLVPSALASALVIAVLAGILGPRIPGAEAEPLYNTRGRGGGDTTVVSPLVDIRSRLTNRGNVELFRVNADAPAYWRVTTLPEFDGRTFRLPRRSLERVDGSFDSGEGFQIRQQIQVLSLGGRLVPAAADPFQASGASGGDLITLNLNRETTTLVAPDDIQPGDVFTVVSARPELGPDDLRTRSTNAAPDPIFTDLPDDLPGVVAELARQVTAGAQSPYDQAILLQNWFRTEFDYSLDVQSGHGSNAIESFLNERIGYCEQFSATFAAMARTLGIPSRVAVGFTPGVLNAEGWYSVLGKNAHAWPELWFDGVGWIAFEPTPGRGAPGSESYTNVPAEQDTSGQTGTGGDGGNGGDGGAATLPTTPSTVVPPGTTLVPTTGPTGSTPRSGNAVTPDIGERNLDGEQANGGTAAPAAEDTSVVPWRQVIGVLVVVTLLALPAGIRRWRRRSVRGQGPAERVQAAWRAAVAAAERAGVGGRPSMTAHEWAGATAAQLPVAARPMASLAQIVDQVQFARPGAIDLERAGAYGSSLRHDCELWSHQIMRIADDALTTRQRVKQYFFDY